MAGEEGVGEAAIDDGAGAGAGAGAGTGAATGVGEGAGAAAGSAHWSEAYPSLVGHPTVTKFEDPGKMAESYVELETKIGQKGVIVPKEGASEAEMDTFHASLGRPQDSTAYFAGWKPPEGLPWDTSMQDAMGKTFHKLGLTTAQAAGVRDTYAEAQSRTYKDMQSAVATAGQDSMAKLQEIHGDSLPAKIDIANRAGEWFMGSPEAWAELMNKPFADGTNLGNSQPWIAAAIERGGDMAEAKVFGMGETRILTKSPQDAQAELNSLKIDKGFMAALTNNEHVEHKQAYERWTALFQQLHPEGPA